MFRYPGFPSLVVPYHDCNDFFYSGHIGSSFIMALEARAQGWMRLHYMCLFIMINEWALMMFIRTHYVIDMVTGVIMAHYMHMLAEKVSYLIDVKVMRQNATKPDQRKGMYFKPCDSCGWGNKCAKNYIHTDEIA